ncbi:MAG: TIGR02186 family protein [Desulfobaccales bacterium]
MKQLTHSSFKIAMVMLGVLLAGLSPAQAAEPTLKVSPDNVQIGTFFSGQTLTVEGAIPAGSQAVLEVVGASADEHLMRKGRRSFLWMNVGEITVHDAPSLYLVMSTAKELLTSATGEATWGYQSLEKRIAFTGDIEAAERPMFMKQFLELKESEHIYATFPGALKVKAAGGQSAVAGKFFLPTNTKPGTYKVVLSVISDGKMVSSATTELTVAMVGFPALLADLAYKHGATYGIIAVVIAIVTGFAMGFLFKGGGGH